MSILKISVRQIKAARSLLDWSQERLAEASGVSIPTVRRLEAADGELGGREDTAGKIVAALQAAGVEFTNGKRPGVRTKQWEPGEKVRLRQGLERYASTLGIEPREVATVEKWELLPGQAPSGHFRLRRATGAILVGLPASHFERILPDES